MRSSRELSPLPTTTTPLSLNILVCFRSVACLLLTSRQRSIRLSILSLNARVLCYTPSLGTVTRSNVSLQVARSNVIWHRCCGYYISPICWGDGRGRGERLGDARWTQQHRSSAREFSLAKTGRMFRRRLRIRFGIAHDVEDFYDAVCSPFHLGTIS